MLISQCGKATRTTGSKHISSCEEIYVFKTYFLGFIIEDSFSVLFFHLPLICSVDDCLQ